MRGDNACVIVTWKPLIWESVWIVVQDVYISFLWSTNSFQPAFLEEKNAKKTPQNCISLFCYSTFSQARKELWYQGQVACD